MSVSEHFDVAVIGGTLSATLVSSLLSERRYRGVLIDQGELSRVPSSAFTDLIMVDDASSIMQFVHAELRVNDRIARQTQKFEAFLQLVYPDERIDVSADRQGLLREFNREFGSEARGDLQSLLNGLEGLEEESSALLDKIGTLPATGFLAKRAAAVTARQFKVLQSSLDDEGLIPGLSRSVQELALGLLPFITYLDARAGDSVRVMQMVRPVLRLLRGVARFEDGAGLRKMFETHARRGGFSVYHDAVERMESQGKRHILSLAESRRQISCDYVIDASADLSGLGALPTKQLRSLARTLQDARPKGALHAMSFEVDQRVVPNGMGENVLLLNGRGRVRELSETAAEDRPILLLCRPIKDHASKPRVRLTALHPLSDAESHVTSEIDHVIRARIQRLIPFLEQGKPSVESLFSSGKSRAPHALLSHPLYDAGVDETWGITGVSNSTPIKSVLIAGPAVIPGLGLEGEYLSSLQACDELDRRARGTKHPRILSKRR